jgi:hypothetical protein
VGRAAARRLTLTAAGASPSRREHERPGSSGPTTATRPSYERVRDDPTWTTHELDGKHNLMRDNPDDLPRILLEVGTR